LGDFFTSSEGQPGAQIFDRDFTGKKSPSDWGMFFIHRLASFSARVARFFEVHDSKTGKNVPNKHKM
jgi:hypothetical protein